jgi:hypothetical protein
MNSKLTVGIIASIAISLGAFGIVGTSDFMSSDTEVDSTIQNPTNSYKQNEKTLYGPEGIGTYIVTNPTDVVDRSDIMIKGTLVDIQEVTKYWNENAEFVPKESEDIRAEVEVVYYTIKVDENLKGETDETVVIKSLFGTYVDYKVGDTVIAMISDENGEITLNSGPHGMFKIQNGQAIGHEKTLPEESLLSRVTIQK